MCCSRAVSSDDWKSATKPVIEWLPGENDLEIDPLTLARQYPERW